MPTAASYASQAYHHHAAAAVVAAAAGGDPADGWDIIDAAKQQPTPPALAPAAAATATATTAAAAATATATAKTATATTPAARAADAAWLRQVFPAKPAEKRAAWLAVLRDNEFETVAELGALDADGWNGLPLPLAIKSALRQAAAAAPAAAAAAAPAALAAAARPVEQLDMVVMDISGSMRATSALDPDKTREDVSKMLFHTLIDKTLHFEVDHAVGLIAFGENITPIVVDDVNGAGGGGGDGRQLTRNYERFHDQLGRLDATERRTTLYDSIAAAAGMLAAYERAECGAGSDEQPEVVAGAGGPSRRQRVQKRIFVLTDGDDNASQQAPWEVSRLLQDQGIVLDAIPLAGANSTLHAMCTASGGLCFQCTDQEQSIALFEREATLRLRCREALPAPPAQINNPADFAASRQAAERASPVVSIRSAVSKKVFAPALSAAQAQAKAKAVAAGTGGGTGGGGGGGGGGGSGLRRVMKEYGELCAKPLGGAKVFVSADDPLEWKAVLAGDELTAGGGALLGRVAKPAPHYAGGHWLLSISFPANYPFEPPRVRFVTPCYHCNVSPDGMICLDMLQSSWSPALTIKKALAGLQELLLAPDAANPLDAYKGALFRDDQPAYELAAAAHTKANAADDFAALATKYNLPVEPAVSEAGAAAAAGSTVGTMETKTTTTTTTVVTTAT